MEIKGNITFKYEDGESARIVHESLEVDNKDFLTSKLENNEINYQITSKNLGSFLLTLDDLIACEIISEKILEKQ